MGRFSGTISYKYLYFTTNAADIRHSYAGAGAMIGRAMTFGYILAGLDLAEACR